MLMAVAAENGCLLGICKGTLVESVYQLNRFIPFLLRFGLAHHTATTTFLHAHAIISIDYGIVVLGSF